MIQTEQCQFCEDFSAPPDGPQRPIWQNADFVVLPPIGCFTPGYLLLMPRQHVRSFACLRHQMLGRAIETAERVRVVVKSAFGQSGVIIAEHGAGGGSVATASTCDHAHWHIIPVDPRFVLRVCYEAAGAPGALSAPDKIRSFRGKSYVLLSPESDEYLVWPYSEVFYPQFMRKVCADYHEVGEFYNWREFAFTANMLLTRERLASEIEREMQNP